jgi:hypothetical protein
LALADIILGAIGLGRWLSMRTSWNRSNTSPI